MRAGPCGVSPGISIVPGESSTGTDEDSTPCTSGLCFPFVSHSPEMPQCCVPVVPPGSCRHSVLYLKGRPEAEQVPAHGLEPFIIMGQASP